MVTINSQVSYAPSDRFSLRSRFSNMESTDERGASPSRLVVRNSFLEVVEAPLESERDRAKSMPTPASKGSMADCKENSALDAPKITEQLLSRMWNLRAQAGPATQVPAAPIMGTSTGSGHDRRNTTGDEPSFEHDQSSSSAGAATCSSGYPVPPAAGYPPGLLQAQGLAQGGGGSAGANGAGVHRSASSVGEPSLFSNFNSDNIRAAAKAGDDDCPAEASVASTNTVLEGPKTTVMLRNIPNQYTRTMLLELLDAEGFTAQYDFVYLPIDFGNRCGFGYAFINLVDPDVAEQFRERFEGYSTWSMPSDMVADVTWSSTHQGYEQHVDRYRNSPVMHETMPDECKPIALLKGVRIDFPPPTKSLRPPRIRPAKNRLPRNSKDTTNATVNTSSVTRS